MTSRIRIIGGQWKRRLLPVPDAPGLRPTPDRVRETLFNWLGQDLTGWRCIDLFAGSGALGFEAASRGAARVDMVEQNPAIARGLQGSIQLVAAPRDEAAGAGSRHTQRLVGKDRLGCAGNGCFTARAFGEHGSLVDEAPRQRAGFDQPARDQFDVGPGGHQ